MPRSPKPKPKPNHGTTDRPDEPWRYEVAIASVEAIVERLETGNLDLAEAFEQFAEAARQLQTCDRFLKEHEAQADLLIECLDEAE